MPLKNLLLAAAILLGLPLLATANNGADVGIIVPPEVFTQQGAGQPTPCLQCCIYGNKSYTEGAIIKTEGILLQCSRENQVLSTNPLIWQRVKP
ncbi:YnjH family protein [Klebsiella sp. BIGb0407]|uniref:YnjH family protein n=1 Tax=Klebsiella sp. BIGb0407 TaxID=2940603 RepID=UPI002167C7CB|nr:YnjH family protein [Klebsiella sp. BIGb0407]MCS3429526.1 hypothetical protein [Klebsiella sp. BIGb0407]